MITPQWLKQRATAEEWEAGRQLAQAGRMREVRRQKDVAEYMLSLPPHYLATLRAPQGSGCECGQEHCRHLVAAVLTASESGALSELLRSQQALAAPALFEAMEGTLPEGARLQLEPSLFLDGPEVSISLRIGEGKLYVVKHIPHFLQSLNGGEALELGRGLNLQPQWGHFGPRERALLEMLDGYCQALAAGRNVLVPAQARRLPLNQRVLHQVLQLIGTLTFRLTAQGKTLLQHGIDTQPLPAIFRVGGSPGALRIQAQLPRHLESVGDDGAYLYLDGVLARTPPEDRALIRTLLRFRTGEHAEFVFARVDISRVMGEVLPQLMRAHAVTVDPLLERQLLRLPFAAKVYLDRDGAQIVARTVFAYGPYETDPFVLREDTPPLLMRDALGERRVLDALAAAGFRVRKGYIYMDGDEDIYRFITEGLSDLNAKAEVFMSQEFKRLQPRQPRLQGRLASRSGGLQLELTDDGTPVEELLPLMEALQKQKRYFRYRDGTFLRLDGMQDWQDFARGISEAARQSRDGRDLGNYRAAYLQALAQQAGLPVDADAPTQAAAQLQGEDAQSPVDGLHPYQLLGFQWIIALRRLGLGGILADEMGLGKTVQTIAAIAYSVQTQVPRQPSIIVMPTSLLYNWSREFARFAPQLVVTVAQGSGARRAQQIERFRAEAAPDVLLTSYPLLRQDIDLLEGIDWRYAVLDEAQNVKNAGSQAAAAVRRLQAQTRLALSGTPMENNIGELWALFDFILPGYLLSQLEFLRRYDEGRNRADLLLRIRPFLLRRLKREVMQQLPDKIETAMPVTMPPEQRRVYAAAFMQMRLRVEDLLREKGMAASRLDILAAMTQLRQICCHPVLVLPDYSGPCGKLEWLMDMLPSSLGAGRRILLFSQFTSMLKIISRRLSAEGIDSLYLDGETPAAERAQMAERFNAGGEQNIFLISLKAGGTGLNLTGADMVIHFDPWWNPQAEDQAADRAHRLGQTRAVQVIRLLMHDSIEERVVAMGRAKRKLFDQLVTPGETFPAQLRAEDILNLFGDPS